MEIWVATSNKGKLNEVTSFLANQEVHSQGELDFFSPPEETGDSFEANARLKAKALHAVKNDCWVLADDSGLEVDGLNFLPGIHSARYAGPKATDPENTTKLLKMMGFKCANNRKARFRCVMVAISPSGEEMVFEGTLEGEISKLKKGTEGFGYDNVFVPEGESQTLAELGLAFKNRVSHRAQALRKFLEVL